MSIDGTCCIPRNRPESRTSTQCLDGDDAPVIAATDYMKLYADQIRPYVPAPYRVLGTDGFGRSDTRQQLRWFFEVDRHFVTMAALASLADKQIIARSVVRDAMQRFGIDPEKAESSAGVRRDRSTHMAQQEVQIPDIGDAEDVEVIEILVKAGAQIA